MRKGSKEAKAWGRKMKRLREGKSTKKGMRRKTYEGLKKRTRRSRCVTKCITRRYKKKSDNFSF